MTAGGRPSLDFLLTPDVGDARESHDPSARRRVSLLARRRYPANGGSARHGNHSGRSLLGASVQDGRRFSRNAVTPSAESAIRPVS